MIEKLSQVVEGVSYATSLTYYVPHFRLILQIFYKKLAPNLNNLKMSNTVVCLVYVLLVALIQLWSKYEKNKLYNRNYPIGTITKC
jgi:hypothetical protein